MTLTDNLSGINLQVICVTSVSGVDVIGQVRRDVIGRLFKFGRYLVSLFLLFQIFLNKV